MDVQHVDMADFTAFGDIIHFKSRGERKLIVQDGWIYHKNKNKADYLYEEWCCSDYYGTGCDVSVKSIFNENAEDVPHTVTSSHTAEWNP